MTAALNGLDRAPGSLECSVASVAGPYAHLTSEKNGELIGRRMPLADAAEAQDLGQRGGVGKILLLMPDFRG